MDNILISIKKLLGLSEDYEAFDQDILIHINSVVSILSVKGVGPLEGFYVTDETTWNDYIPDHSKIEMIKTYVYLRVRMMFDPPTTSFLADTINEQIKEYEFYLNILSDPT